MFLRINGIRQALSTLSRALRWEEDHTEEKLGEDQVAGAQRGRGRLARKAGGKLDGLHNRWELSSD